MRLVLASPAGKLFPHQEMYKWLVYGNGECESHCVSTAEPDS